MGVQRSVRNERIPRPKAGPMRSGERDTRSKSLALGSVAIFRGRLQGRRSGVHSASFLFSFFWCRGEHGVGLVRRGDRPPGLRQGSTEGTRTRR